MSYTKTTWSDGDVITAEKLNNIESGVESANSSGSILVVRVVNGALDKTWQEIRDSFINMIPVYYYEQYEGNGFGYVLTPVHTVSFEDNTYCVFAYDGREYTTTSPSGYPEPSDNIAY